MDSCRLSPEMRRVLSRKGSHRSIIVMQVSAGQTSLYNAPKQKHLIFVIIALNAERISHIAHLPTFLGSR